MEDNYRESLVRRIEECEMVVRDLEASPAWKVLITDLSQQRDYIDSNWQNIYEADKLQRARELKNAVQHIITLKARYQEELSQRKNELRVQDNPDQEIQKDYDTETNLEK